MGASKVVVAMSGGVDSSVAAALLVREGHDVVGMTLDVWPADGESDGRACCGYQAAEDARRVCHVLDIPHYVLNFREPFKRAVIDDFCGEYLRGRTPNPCIRCNDLIKFGLLMSRARELGAALLATGHYARILRDQDGAFGLTRAVDRAKDQSYALYCLDQSTMARSTFPLGAMTKDSVRAEARRVGLRVADKPESQEVCFVSSGRYAQFVRERAGGGGAGEIADMSGTVVGRHEGIEGYTVGQRKGLGSEIDGPKYVVAVESRQKRVVIGDAQDLYASRLLASDARWPGETPNGELAVSAKVRYNMQEAPARVEALPDRRVRVVFDQAQRAITPGQAVVFYDGDLVVGGATIDGVEQV